MARRGETSAAPIPGDPDAVDGWRVLGDQYLLSLELRGLSAATVYGRKRAIARFATWGFGLGVTSPLSVGSRDVDAYRVHLHRDLRLRTRTQQQYLIAISGLYRWLLEGGRIDNDPTGHVDYRTHPLPLPVDYLSERQAERVLALPDLSTHLGRRDRTMLEVLYATGIRRTELASIRLHDLDVEQQALLVHQGKGGRDRLIPIGPRAATWVVDYLTVVRPRLTRRRSAPESLFITRQATPICSAHVGKIVAGYLRRAGVARGSCHVFRHTAATLMLHNGADLRSIQALLGHANLASTQRYTHLNIDHLTHVHRTTHPSALGWTPGDQRRGLRLIRAGNGNRADHVPSPPWGSR